MHSQETATSHNNHSVQDIFERRTRLHPGSPAVYGASGDCWSYTRLNEFANKVAHRLLRRGVTPEQRVGVCMQRSPETVGVLLGILKARAAYVPLDLNLPHERLRYIAGDAMVKQIFVDEAGRKKLHEAGVTTVEVLAATDNVGLPHHSPELPSSKHDLANILYTSGSTGKPKGALLEHAGVLRLVVDTTWLTFSPSDVFLQISALSFDLSTFEVWGPLLNGGCLVTAPPSPSIGEIAGLLDKFKVTTLWLTAGLFNVVMEERPDAIRKIKYLLTGGDIASPRHARTALMHLERGELLNCYGPTENATFSTCHRVTLQDTEQPSIPIGLAVDSSPAYLLDESLQPIHDSRVGEIFVGGEGLTRGYWNRPELTAEKFLLIETGRNIFTRLYRTGDLGRYNASELLEFVGRTDFQVKIRGFRVEPEEIELALSAMPGLAAAAVIAKGANPESKQLCCYYVQDKTRNITTAAIRSFLMIQFPDYMVPALFREVESLPRNTNDKVDRKALENLPVTSRTAGSAGSPLAPVKEIYRERAAGSTTAANSARDDKALTLNQKVLPFFGLFAQARRIIRKATSAFRAA
jgi:amino acid adenylation domain-containing protein